MTDSKTNILRAQMFRTKSLFVILGIFVVIVWLGSCWYIRHGVPNQHSHKDRLQTIALVGEAMTITNVLFAGLGFVALIGTVWLQRQQLESAMQSIKETSDAQREYLRVLQAQSKATRGAAEIGALSILIPIKQETLDALRRQVNTNISSRLTPQLPTLETEQEERIAMLEKLLKQLQQNDDPKGGQIN